MGIGGITPDQILDVVRQQLQPEADKIQEKRDDVTAQEDLKLAYDSIDNILEKLRDSLFNFTKTNTFLQRTVASSDSDTVVASASSNAPETSYVFSAIGALAQAADITSDSGLGLAVGTAPVLESDSDINGPPTGNYNQNNNITIVQGLTPEITAGTFTINDTDITIDNNDTLMTILTKINNSGAGVTATFDDFTDFVRISGNTVGSDQEITFSDGDTSFFTALNMTSATAGTNDQKDDALDDGPLSAVTSGYFTINNFTFFVDPATESLEDVISKVNKSNAGVTMFFDQNSNTVTIQNKQEGENLLLANDSSGFLAAIDVMNVAGDLDATGTYSEYAFTSASFTLNGEALTRDTNTFTINGVTFSLLATTASDVTVTVNQDLDKTVNLATDFVAQFNATLSLLNSEIRKEGGALEDNGVIRDIRLNLLDDVLKQVSNPGNLESLADIGFEVENTGGGNFTLSLNQDEFRTQLQDNETDVQSLFAYDSNGNGLLTDGGYAIATRSYLEDFTRSVSGFFDERKDDIDERIFDLNINIDDMEARLLSLEEKKFFEFADQVVRIQQIQQQAAQVQRSSQLLIQSILG